MDALFRHVRYSLRKLGAHPAFTAAAIASLGLGIGAAATLFTCVNALFLRSLPVADPARLVAVYTTTGASPDLLPTSHPRFRDFRDSARTLSGLAAHRSISVSMGGERPEVVFGELVSGDYFDVLGVHAALGRTFTGEEGRGRGGHPVVVLGHDLWARRFRADPGIVGREVVLNRRPFTVIGVLPEDFRGLALLESPELWVPTSTYETVLSGAGVSAFDDRQTLIFELVGRLAPGSSPEQARSELASLARVLGREHPEVQDDLGVAVVPAAEAALGPKLRHTLTRAGWVLGGATALLLAIACANLAALLLARTVTRRREIAIRLAAGAARGQLARELLAEALVLGLLGGAAGLVLAIWGTDLLWALRPPFLAGSLDLAPDWRSVAFTLAVALATGLLFGVAPVVQSFRVDPVAALQDRPGAGGGAGRKLLRGLVAGQVALSLVALVGAGLFVASLRNVYRTDPGFEIHGLFLVPLHLSAEGYSRPATLAFYRDAVERVDSLQGVRSAAVSERPVLAPGGARYDLVAEGREQATREAGRLVSIDRVGLGYFRMMGIPLLDGRTFAASDREDSPPVAIVNQTLAHRFWPGGRVVGRRLRFTEASAPTAEPIEVVGVARDAAYHGLNEQAQPYLYLPVLQSFTPNTVLHVRTAGDPAGVIPAVRSAIQGLAPELPLPEAREVADLLRRQYWAPRMLAGLLALYGSLALLLTAVGIYGVVAYSVNLTRREIGVRLALGAGRARLLRELLGRGMRPVALGLVVGLAAALAAAPGAAALLFGLNALDPVAFGLAILVLGGVALVAVLIPARRATTAHPAAVLRVE